MTRRRIYVGTRKLLAGLFGAVLVFSACSAAASPTPTVGGATPGPTATTAAAPIELTLIEYQQLRIDALKKVLPDFEAQMAAAGKNVKVKLIENVSNDQEFLTKITLDYSTGAAADVMEYGASAVPDFAAANYLLDLTARLNAWPDWQQHFFKVIRDRTVDTNGKIWWVPNGASYMMLFYRKDVLVANGISTEQPKTWAELITRMKDLQAKLGDCKGGDGSCAIMYPAGTAWGGGSFGEGWIHVFLGTGGKLFDDATGKWIVRSKALTDSFGFYQQMVANKLFPYKPLLNANPWEPTKYVAFPAGKLAVTTQGSWGWIYDWGATGAKPIPDIFNAVSTWQFPTEDGSPPFVWASENHTWTITAKTKHPDEAFALVQFLTSGKAAATMAAAVGDVAARDDLATVAPYSDFPILVQGQEYLKTGKSILFPLGIGKIQDAVAKATEDVISGSMDAAAAAEEFATMVTASLGADKVENAP
jgi:multiple sugar transport system substrate-binding protein